MHWAVVFTAKFGTVIVVPCCADACADGCLCGAPVPKQVDSVKYDQSRAAMSKRIYVVHTRVKFGYRCGVLHTHAARGPLHCHLHN